MYGSTYIYFNHTTVPKNNLVCAKIPWMTYDKKWKIIQSFTSMELSRSSLTIVQDAWTRVVPSPRLVRLRERSDAALIEDMLDNENEYASKASAISMGRWRRPITRNCGSGLALAYHKA